MFFQLVDDGKAYSTFVIIKNSLVQFKCNSKNTLKGFLLLLLILVLPLCICSVVSGLFYNSITVKTHLLYPYKEDLVPLSYSTGNNL